MPLAKHTPRSPPDFKHRVLTCLNKLSDRDTHSAAATELESIAKTLNHDSISPFLSSISTTNSSDKSPVRKQCIRLISTLSETHGNILSPHLSKLLSAVVRRLRDPDTVVRTACVAATASIAAHVTKPPFISVAKPFVDALVTEQDLNAQIGAALCLASAINGAPEPDTAYLRRLLPKVEKLLKSNCFKAKAALLRVVVSVVRVGAASGPVIVKSLVEIMTDFLVKSEDWAVRKGAAEVLEVLAVVEKDLLPEYKASCLKTFEAKKFDKVKGVRETMIQMIEAWNAVLDVPEEVLLQQESHSSKEEEAEIQNPPQITNKRTVPSGSGSATSRKTGPAMFRKLDRKKPNDQKLNTTEGQHSKQRSLKQETKRALFSEITDEKIPESQPHEDMPSSGGAGRLNIDLVHQDEDLSLIRNQLVQIETQQSNLFDLLEKYIGSSQDGMRSLESRVRGLESTLDEISYDLAKSTGQGSNPKPTLCCRLPGADLLSSKLWKKSEIQPSNTRYASSSSSVKKTNHGSYNVGGGSGLIKNPLAEVRQM
ncbi:putative MT-associated protein TORTIFOLIA1/SPIRAL2 [Helianthus anomalus]